MSYRFLKGRYVAGNGNVMELVVDGAGDLADVPAHAAPGSIAYTPDLTGMWMKGPDGEWHRMGGDA